MLPILTKGKIKRKNIFSGVRAPAVAVRDPLDAPDSDFLHWIDFSDAGRMEVLVNDFIKGWVTKAGSGGVPVSYIMRDSNPGIDNTGLINGIVAGFCDGVAPRKLREAGAFPANLKFMYPSMTWFFVIRPEGVVTNTGFLMSDYGNVSNEVINLKVGNGTALEVFATMRDSSANLVEAVSGATVLSLDTDYLLVARMDGINKTIDLWIDGAGSPFTGTNAAYDNTTTWEGEFAGDAVVTLGALSEWGSEPFSGDIACYFSTKIALSNLDINLYANFLANRWGTVWTNI